MKIIPKYFFDITGTRFSPHIMKQAKAKVKDMTLTELSEYVDGVTFQMVERGKTIIPATALNNLSVGNLNMTSFGNTAFIALYHPNELQRDLAKAVLEKLKHYV